MPVPSIRIRSINPGRPNRNGEFVLYWSIAYRRSNWNFALDRAIEWCQELDRPLLVFEPLRAGYRWASDRLHHFVIQGMADNARRYAGTPTTYYPYLEPEPGVGRGLLEHLASKACVVISDDYPAFFLPNMTAAAARPSLRTVRTRRLQRVAAAAGSRSCFLPGA